MDATITLNVTGVDGLLQKAISQVRKEVSASLARVMANETDGRVVSRLNEIVAQLDGDLASAEAQLVIKSAPAPNEPRRAQVERDGA